MSIIVIESFEEVEKCVEDALALEDSIDLTYSVSGYVHLLKRNYDRAIRDGERAVELNPNGADANYSLGFILCFSGKTELSIKLFERAFRLNPIPPAHYYTGLAVAYRNNEQYENAIELAEKCLLESPYSQIAYLVLTSIYSFLNRIEEAQNAAKQILRIAPDF